MSYVINQVNCSGCHRCRMECPMGAIRIKNAKYWIDPDKCVSCGKCKSVCHNGCIASDKPAPAAAPHDTIRLACDVCVIGGGGSGLVAAAKASDMGCSVIVLEKGHEAGGSAWYAGGFRSHYSLWHQQAGVSDPREEVCRDFMEKTGGKVDEKLFRRILDANVDWIDWLIRDHDLAAEYELADMGPRGFGLRQKVFCDWQSRRIDPMIGPGSGGWVMTLKLLGILEKNGGRVLYNTAAKHLVTDDSGAVCGVTAEDAGGRVEISCKSVVVSAGAYTRSKEWMDKMQPLFYEEKEGREPVHVFTHSGCTGDGLTMCSELGADIDYVNRRANLFGPMRHPYPGVTLSIGYGPKFRTNGEPYVSDGMHEISPLAYDDKRYLWKITDDVNAAQNIEYAMSQGPDDLGIDIGPFLKNWRSVLAEEAEDNAVVMADTLEELAEKLGYDPARFVGQIAAYNEALPSMPPKMAASAMTDLGVDGPPMPVELLGPQPKPIAHAPFYAIKLKMFHEDAIGGMVTDENTNVLKDGAPIPGLYASGDNIRGIMLPGDVGVNYIEGVISALTFAFNSGYVSGVEAAAHAGRG